MSFSLCLLKLADVSDDRFHGHLPVWKYLFRHLLRISLNNI